MDYTPAQMNAVGILLAALHRTPEIEWGELLSEPEIDIRLYNQHFAEHIRVHHDLFNGSMMRLWGVRNELHMVGTIGIDHYHYEYKFAFAEGKRMWVSVRTLAPAQRPGEILYAMLGDDPSFHCSSKHTAVLTRVSLALEQVSLHHTTAKTYGAAALRIARIITAHLEASK